MGANRDAPVLYVTGNGIPTITRNELRRLRPVGIGRHDDVQAFVVGAAANPGVLAALRKLGLKYETVTASDPATLADNVDQLYGSIQNPDPGFPIMSTSGTGEGSSTADVVVGSTSAWQYLLPATHWVSHMPTGLLWVTRDSVPQPTIDALKRRMGHAQIYVYGGPAVVSSQVVPAATVRHNQTPLTTRRSRAPTAGGSPFRLHPAAYPRCTLTSHGERRVR